MRTKARIILLIFLIRQCVSLSGNCPNLKNDVKSIRKRRYLAFAEGSDVVIQTELAKSFLTHVPSGWMMVMSLDVIYPLPDEKFISKYLRRKLHHKQKRDLWDRVKKALNLHNLNGHACVLRSICEAKTYLAPPGKSLVHDILRAILTAPVEEANFMEEVGDTYKELKDKNFCDRVVPQCPFSLLDFILAFNKRRISPPKRNKATT